MGLVILDIVLFISLSRGGMGGIARQYGEYCVAASPLSRGEFVGVDVLDDPLTPLSRGEFVGVDVLDDPLTPLSRGEFVGVDVLDDPLTPLSRDDP